MPSGVKPAASAFQRTMEDSFKSHLDSCRAILTRIRDRRFTLNALKCNRIIQNLNDKISPLYQLLRKGVRFIWDDKCQAAFDYVKTCLNSPPVLRSPSASDTFILETDASDTDIGCCLLQVGAMSIWQDFTVRN